MQAFNNRPFRKKGKGKKKSLQKQVNALKRDLKSLEPEVKTFCREESTVRVSTAGVTRDLTLIPEGTDSAERIGTSVTLKSLVVRYRLLVADSTNMVRLIVVRYKGSGSDVSLSDFPDETGVAGLGPLGCWMTLLKEKFHTVLYDELINLGTDAADQALGVIRVNLHRGKTNWDPAESATVPEEGGIMMFARSDSGAATHPDISYISQLNYFDN